MQLPPPLSAGARIALVAPASPLWTPREVELATKQTIAMGWEPVLGPHIAEREGYLAGHDEARASDLNSALRDRSIDGIWCARGGYGTMRILDALDTEAMRRRPKVLLGYSDITALLAAFARRSQVITFHGPTARSKMTPFTHDSLVRAVCTFEDPCGVAKGARVLRGGRASGHLIGGNLALLAALCGTPYAPDYDGAILVLEDVGEQTYRIDRMLRQLLLCGSLQKVAGIAYGHFTEGTKADDVTSRALDTVLREAADLAGVPAIAGIPLGHIDDQWTIPLGAHAELDADERTLNVTLR
jgi:muramoyltetrapeptide carboxypeptidase